MPSAGREGYIGEGGSGAGATSGQRLPYADFFGYFLVQRQESDTYQLWHWCDKLQFEPLFDFGIGPWYD